MRKFLVKLGIFLIPVVFSFFLLEFLLRSMPNDYKLKNAYLENFSDSISCVFLGSSHTYYGVNPDHLSLPSYNLSHISQSLFFNEFLLHKFFHNASNLKFVCLEIGYLTLFGDIASGVEPWRVKNYILYYNYRGFVNLKYYTEILSHRLKLNLSRLDAYYIKNINPITSSVNGYGAFEGKQQDLNSSGKDAARRHTRNDFRLLSANHATLDRIIKFSKDRGIILLLYTLPAYPSYFQELDQYQLSTMIGICEKSDIENDHVFYFNFLKDRSFDADDFRDADHLNKNGAIKFSQKFDSIINNLYNQ